MCFHYNRKRPPNLYNFSYERQKLCLKLGWTGNKNKSQGLTLEKVWADIEKSKKFKVLASVALSRIRKLEDLIVEKMTQETMTL